MVFYSPHNTAKDFEKLGDLLPEADVYIPESPGAVKSNLFLYEKVSNGKLTPKEAIKMMQEHHVKKLVVLEHGWLVGIITTNDIAVLHPKIIENIGKLLSKSFEELE